MEDKLAWIPTDQLVDPPVVLRLVNRNSVEYLELRDSIAERGILNPILVRPSVRFPGCYDVADGLYRTAGCRDTGRSPVPALVRNLTDDDLLAIQIQANALRPETTPMEYARQIKRIMEARPGISQAGLVGIIHKNPGWIRQMLSLFHLRKDCQQAVDRGEVPLGSACVWAQIPYSYQEKFLDAARTLPVHEFRPLAQAFLKQFKEARRQGKLDAFFTEEFKPQAHGRPWREIIAEHKKPERAGVVLAVEDCRTLMDAWRAALAWVLHLDKQSIEAQRQAVMNRARRRKEPPDKQPES
jgi:ParB/RepB/Spo0J family partition protein